MLFIFFVKQGKAAFTLCSIVKDVVVGAKMEVFFLRTLCLAQRNRIHYTVVDVSAADARAHIRSNAIIVCA